MKKKYQEKTSNPIRFNSIWIRVIVSVLVLVVYGSTINFQYTLDDDIFYQKHESVQKGVEGIGELFTNGSMEKFDGSKGIQPYRPITLLSFAIEKHLYDNDPSKSHLINVFLYIAVIQLLITILLKIVPRTNPWLFIIVVLLFTLHPVHTEVVSSVKSRDELLAALFGLTAWIFFIKKTDSFSYAVISSVFLFLALMSKESGIAFMAVLPLAFYMFHHSQLKTVMIRSIPLIIATLIFLLIRVSIIGTQSYNKGIAVLDNTLNAAQGFSQISATKMEILYHYLRLLFFPWPLSWDYSFNQIPLMDWSETLPWISFVLHFLLIIAAVFFFKKNPLISFSILFYFITMAPTNNFFFNNGATLAERFLFTPSIGFALAIYGLSEGLTDISKQVSRSKLKPYWMIIFLAISILYFKFSFERTKDWESNFTLFKTGVIACPNSSRANQALGIEYENRAREEQDTQLSKLYTDSAITYLSKGISILPGNADATFKLAQIYEKRGEIDNAKEYYRQTIRYKPEYYVASNNIGVLFAIQKNWDSALYYFNLAYKADRGIELTLSNLMVANFNKQRFDLVVKYGEEAKNLGYNNPKCVSLLEEARKMIK